MSKKRGGGAPPEPAAPKPAGPLTQKSFAALKSMHDAMAREASEAEALRARRAAEEIAQKSARQKAAEDKRREEDRRFGVHAGASGTSARRPGPSDVWRPDTDKELFAVAMSGVVPLGGKDRPARVRPGPQSGGGAGGNKLRRARAEGDEGLTVRWSEDGQCAAARAGREFALEALGRFAVPQDRLDLHGLEPAEARTRVSEFVRTRRARGMRVVCVVHGTGKHSPDGQSVLRDAAVQALAEAPGSREVDAFCTASSAHGGNGALMVSLRGG